MTDRPRETTCRERPDHQVIVLADALTRRAAQLFDENEGESLTLSSFVFRWEHTFDEDLSLDKAVAGSAHELISAWRDAGLLTITPLGGGEWLLTPTPLMSHVEW